MSSNGDSKVSLVVTTQNSFDASMARHQLQNDQPLRPDTLRFLNPSDPSVIIETDDEAENHSKNHQRRGSKSCLKVDPNTLSPSGLVSPNSAMSSSSPARRRSVHFDASPAATVEVPSSDADKAQRGCGSLLGPAPFSAGKEVYVAPPPPDPEDENDEDEKRLALARAIARRQSGQVHSPTTVDKMISDFI